jgi:Tfp pilus assembly protein PilX
MSSSGIAPSAAAERGFVLATTLLATTLLTVMLAAAFLLVSAEQRTTDNSFSTARALALAQAGLQTYFSQNRGLADTSTYDSMRVALSSGYADLVATRVRPGGSSTGSPLALWVVRSTGVVTSRTMAGQVQGTRTIAQFAQLNLGLFPARAALVALNGLRLTGSGSHPVGGHDLGSISPCVSPGGSAADTFGISYPSGLYAPSTPPPAGEPTTGPTLAHGLEPAYANWSDLYDSTHIDWPSLISGNFIPDYTIPPAPWPPYSNNYLVGYIPGDATIPSGQRRGVLVITGNVTVISGTHWDGIILAGGNLTVSPPGASFKIHGMIVTGLNRSLGQFVPPDTLARGATMVQWTWCYTQSSINSLSNLVPLNNGWADTWSTY